jgi:hypothetical protein
VNRFWLVAPPWPFQQSRKRPLRLWNVAAVRQGCAPLRNHTDKGPNVST